MWVENFFSSGKRFGHTGLFVVGHRQIPVFSELSQWAQDVHRTSPGRLLVPVYFRRPEIKMGPDLDFILRDVLRTSLGRPIKNYN